MATGNYVGPYSKFAVVCDYNSYTDHGDGTYTVKFNCHISVDAGSGGFNGTIVTTNWSAGQVSIYKDDTGYGEAYVTAKYGSSANFTAEAYYINSAQTITYKSSVTVSYTYTPTYTVSYNSNGGYGSMSQDKIIYGNNYYTKQNEFTRDGYHFIGWNESSDGSGVDWTDYIDVAWKWTYKKNVTLYAQWEPNIYQIILNPNQGSISTHMVNITYNTKENNELKVFPVRSGCEFLGWYDALDGGVQVYDASGICINDETYWSNNNYIYAGNITLYAHWKYLNVSYCNINDKYVLCNTYGKINGVWKPMLFYGKINGTWKQSIIEQ